jgi:hypothetical protein
VKVAGKLISYYVAMFDDYRNVNDDAGEVEFAG